MRSKTTALAAYGLFFTGLSLIMLSVLGAEVWHWPIWGTGFLRDIGLLLAAVMAGTILHEKLLRDEMLRLLVHELDRKLEAKIPKLEDIAAQTAAAAHQLFSERPPGMTGIRLLHDVRRNFSGYYSWVNEQKPQELFFAGRSVLHRIDADIWSRTGGSAEDILLRRLKEGSKVTILFLDPRIDIIHRLANEEAQASEEMLRDIAISLGICKRLYELLQTNLRTLPPGAELSIRVYDRVPYFAYHKQDAEVIVGFYFLSAKGSTSAAYEVVDEITKQVFDAHFVRIYSDASASSILEFEGARGRPSFNIDLFQNLLTHLSEKLGQERADEALNRKYASTSPKVRRAGADS
jgi:hypothetical protein